MTAEECAATLDPKGVLQRVVPFPESHRNRVGWCAIWQLLHVALALLAWGASACSLSEGRTGSDDRGVALTFLANEGVLITWDGPDVLVDALFDINVPPGVPPRLHDHPSPDLLHAMEAGAPPFDDIGLMLVTHGDDDHFTPESVARHLSNNPQALLVCPANVAQAVESSTPSLHERILTPSLAVGSVEELEPNGVHLHVLGVPHAGSARRAIPDPLDHHAYVVELNGSTVLHLGDAEASEAALEALDWAAAPQDLVLVPHWFIADDASVELLERRLTGVEVIVMHANRGNRDEVAPRVATVAARWPRPITLFGSPMDRHALEIRR
jgi:L-ascorbate metabolism protein UlaG (beta-lactamase superfamily)